MDGPARGRTGRGRGRSRGRGSVRGGGRRGGESRGRQGRGGNRGGRQPQENGRPASGRGRTTTTRAPPVVGRNEPPKLKNGEKGADANQVSEAYRIELSKVLLDFREDYSKDSLEFPSTLTNTERKYVHLLAGQLGLKSKSTGKGEDRKIKITRVAGATQKSSDVDELPVLQIGKAGEQSLMRHVEQFPPSPYERAESRETGSAFLEESTQQQFVNSFVQPEIQTEARDTSRPLNLHLRRKNHAASQERKRKNKQYAAMQRHRSQLPALSHEEEVATATSTHQVVIVAGETGCGKSTQVPQFLLDNNPEAKICVTQPRRLAAISIADRVAAEQCDSSLVGHHVRLESSVTAATQLVFCTPGVLLQQLRSSPTLDQYTHIVLDEVHERDKYQEFLMIVLRDLLAVRSDLRVILMSATLETLGLSEFFGEAAVVKMKGRMFPVQEYFLEDALTMTGYFDGVIKQPGVVGGRNDPVLSLSMQCALCGKRDFANAMELGVHVALCEGVDEDENGADVAGFTTASDAEEAPSLEFETYDVDGTSFAEFEAYDVESKAEAVEYASIQSTHDDGGPLNNTTEKPSAEKWDGEDPFAFTVMKAEPQSEIDKQLEEYQTMHDDETIDNGLLLDIMRYIVGRGDGGILTFLPGWQEISEMALILEGTPPFNDRSRYLILTLHSGIPSRDQKRVLQRPPPGVRKVVLSTNIAETSLTIDDIVYVIDSGRAKEKNYDPHLKTSTLQPAWISQASAKQRKGRAGRVMSGICFRLFSSRRHESMVPFTESELLRTPLEEMCLMCKKLHLAPGGVEDDDGIPAFLAKAMSAPHSKSVENAIELLVDLGAMQPESNELTALGECLSLLSLEPRVGKMVLWSYLLGCTRVATNMAVAMSYKSPFVLPRDSQRRAANAAKVQLSRQSESDQITMHYALEMKETYKTAQSLEAFCRKSFINQNTMQMVSELRKNLARELTRMGFTDPMKRSLASNKNDKFHSVWYGAIAAGLYPNVAFRHGGHANFTTMSNHKMKIHLGSVNAVAGQPLNSKSRKAEKDLEFICFGELVKGARLFTGNQTTHLVSPLPLLLLCGKALCVRPSGEGENMAVLTVDDWITFLCDANLAANLVVLRKRLESAFWRAISNPRLWSTSLTEVESDAVQVLGATIESSYRIYSS